MAKSLVLGNGTLTVGLDNFGQVKDCYFDYVGLENHMSEDSVHRIGIWVDGEFSWVSDGGWEIDIDYKEETLIGQLMLRNPTLQIEIEVTDCVYNESSIFIRHFIVKNTAEKARVFRLFLNFEFRMYGVKKGDTVYWDPEDQTVVHYKGRRVAVIGGLCGENGPSDFTVGLSTIEGREGTWRDAEDGILSKNNIEHGTVDSTLGYEMHIDTGGSQSVVSWVTFAKTLSDAKKLHEMVVRRSPGKLIETTEDFWRAWVNKTPIEGSLPKDLISLYKKSLLITRVHVGNMGEIIASVDSEMLQWGRDNYSYVWPRDGAFVAMALDMANYSEVSRRFFEFCNSVISEDGFFFHKYRPDKSLGSSWHGWVGHEGERQLPIQEDETALILIALWKHYAKTKDIEFIESIYNSLIKKAGNFLLGFRGEDKLPYASYDIWEMKLGTHTFTVGTVYQALLSAADFASLLGKDYEESHYRQAAEEVKVAASLLWNEETNFFHKSVTKKNDRVLHDETIDASSFYGAWAYKLFSEEQIEEAYKTYETKLSAMGNRGGIIRFVDDAYYRDDPGLTGNAWFITTLWKAQYLVSIAKTESDMRAVVEILQWVVSLATKSGMLSEQIHPVTGSPLSASPLAWSHAEYIKTVTLYLEKEKEIETEKLENSTI